MTRPLILVVDDDAALLEALPETLRLRMEGIDVDTCDSAPEALKMIERTDYDVIVSDIKMPGMDGLALLADDAVYNVPSNDRPLADSKDTLFIIADDIRRIRARVTRLKDKSAHVKLM